MFTRENIKGRGGGFMQIMCYLQIKINKL